MTGGFNFDAKNRRPSYTPEDMFHAFILGMDTFALGLIKAAKDNDLKFAVDIYPFYGSDVDATLDAGYDIRHGLIGSGVYASHGYERSHKDGVENTLKLLAAYCK